MVTNFIIDLVNLMCANRRMKRQVSHDVFRDRVVQVLSRTGLTYAAFARKAGLDRSTLSQLLTGPIPRLPRAETLAAIARTAHVSVDWLLGLSQREEVGAEIIEAVMQIEPDRTTPAHDAFLGWLRTAQGSRVCTVPVGMPDLLKVDEVLRLEYAAAFDTRAMTPADAVRRRLEMMRQPLQQLEIATSKDCFAHFAAGIGLWAGLSAAVRREQVKHMIALADELYPSLRVYLYQAGQAYSAPFTIFGAQRVAIFLGSSYLVLNSAEHILIFSSRFDDLIRAAVVQPHQFASHLRELLRHVR
jgi:transcriptional regulator with XRE-family HTH domain